MANPKAASSHVDAVYSRKCINFILRSTLGKMLGEKAQTVACKEIAQIIVEEMNSIDFNPENAKDFNQETLFSQHLLVCALQEIGCLVLSLGTTAYDLITDQSLSKQKLLAVKWFVCILNLFRFNRTNSKCFGASMSGCTLSSCVVFEVYLCCCT